MSNLNTLWLQTGCCFVIAFVGLYLILKKNKIPASEHANHSSGFFNFKIIGIFLIVIGFGFALFNSKKIYELSTYGKLTGVIVCYISETDTAADTGAIISIANQNDVDTSINHILSDYTNVNVQHNFYLFVVDNFKKDSAMVFNDLENIRLYGDVGGIYSQHLNTYLPLFKSDTAMRRKMLNRLKGMSINSESDFVLLRDYTNTNLTKFKSGINVKHLVAGSSGKYSILLPPGIYYMLTETNHNKKLQPELRKLEITSGNEIITNIRFENI